MHLHQLGKGSKAIASQLKREQSIVVSYKTIQRILSGERKLSMGNQESIHYQNPFCALPNFSSKYHVSEDTTFFSDPSSIIHSFRTFHLPFPVYSAVHEGFAPTSGQPACPFSIVITWASVYFGVSVLCASHHING